MESASNCAVGSRQLVLTEVRDFDKQLHGACAAEARVLYRDWEAACQKIDVEARLAASLQRSAPRRTDQHERTSDEGMLVCLVHVKGPSRIVIRDKSRVYKGWKR